MKEPLTPGEALVLNQLNTLAGGIGLMKERGTLNATQTAALEDLKRKGYVMLTHSKFLVIAAP